MTSTFQMVGWDVPDLAESMSESTLDNDCVNEKN